MTTPEASDVMTRNLAIYGATLATINAVWSIYKDRRDCAAFTVRVAIASVDMYDDGPLLDSGMTFAVVNSGKRTGYIKQVGAVRHDGHREALGLSADSPPKAIQGLPAKIEPGERVLIRTYLLAHPDQFYRLGVVDTLGQWSFAPAADLEVIQRLTANRSGDAFVVTRRARLRHRLPLWMKI